jgi:hypothetical protein
VSQPRYANAELLRRHRTSGVWQSALMKELLEPIFA